MGGVWSSTTTDPNSPSSNSTIPTNSLKADSPPNSPNLNMSNSDSKTPEDQSPKHPLDHQLDSKTVEEEKHREGEDQSENDLEEEEEEKGECGFCLFMKAGGCRESFIAWEECVEESEKSKEDVVEKCSEVTATLKKCMEAHPDYYEPILRAEKAAEEEAVKELEKEKASKSSEQNATLEISDQHGSSSEKRSEGEVVRELEKEKASTMSEQNAASESSDQQRKSSEK